MGQLQPTGSLDQAQTGDLGTQSGKDPVDNLGILTEAEELAAKIQLICKLRETATLTKLNVYSSMCCSQIFGVHKQAVYMPKSPKGLNMVGMFKGPLALDSSIEFYLHFTATLPKE